MNKKTKLILAAVLGVAAIVVIVMQLTGERGAPPPPPPAVGDVKGGAPPIKGTPGARMKAGAQPESIPAAPPPAK